MQETISINGKILEKEVEKMCNATAKYQKQETIKLKKAISKFADKIATLCQTQQEPETFGEILFLLRKKINEMKVVWYGDCFVDKKEEEFWFKGILFNSNHTLAIRDNNENIRVIMSGISYPLMWQIIESDLKLWRNNEKNRTYTCNSI